MGSKYSVDSNGNLTTAGSITSTSTTSGFLLPSMTTTQRNAIPSPADGLQIFNTTTNQIEFYNGSVWGSVGSGSGVSSINTLTGAITLSAGTGITLSPVGNNITISAPSSVTGSGTTNRVARWSSSTTLAAGAITDTGSVVQMQVSPIIQIGSGGSTATTTMLMMQDTTSGGAAWLHGITTMNSTFASVTNIFAVPQDCSGDLMVVGENSANHIVFVDKMTWSNTNGTASVSAVYSTSSGGGATARSYSVLSNQLRMQMSGNIFSMKLALYSLYPF